MQVGYRLATAFGGAALALAVATLSGSWPNLVFLFVFCEALMAVAAVIVNRKDGWEPITLHVALSCLITFGLLISAPPVTRWLGLN